MFLEQQFGRIIYLGIHTTQQGKQANSVVECRRDELFDEPTSAKVYAKKGSKTVHYKERGKPKENIMVTYAVSAEGSSIPPLVTFNDSFSGIEASAMIAKTIGADLPAAYKSKKSPS